MPTAPSELLRRIADCVQAGKADRDTDIPPGSRGEVGAAELVAEAIAEQISPQTILQEGLTAGMTEIGRKFAENEAFVPELLIAAQAMHAGMAVLKPHFVDSEAPSRGVFVIGTVRGDLHDIGKNLVGIMVEGAGWRLVDLGVDCSTEKFIAAIEQHPGCAVGLSALLTTTMLAMRDTIATIREKYPEALILVGGAPVTADFAKEIGASAYAAHPSAAIPSRNAWRSCADRSRRYAPKRSTASMTCAWLRAASAPPSTSTPASWTSGRASGSRSPWVR